MTSTQSQLDQRQASKHCAELTKILPTDEEFDGDQQDALKSIRVMLQREQTSYTIPNSLAGVDDESSSPRPFSVYVRPRHRQKMVEWCFAMVETMELRRETIERAINCIDRFVLLKEGRVLLSDPTLYQRAVITALYLMIKLHEEEAIPIEDMAFVCSGGDENVDDEELDHTSEQLEAMEIVILTELQWYINPPTSYEYLAQFLKLLGLPVLDEFDPICDVEEDDEDSVEDVVRELNDVDLKTSFRSQVSAQSRDDSRWLMELATFELQEGLQDYDSAKKGAFHAAYNAILNALPMLDDGAEMAVRLEALLSAVVPDLERYQSSDSSSDTSTTSRDSLSSAEDESICSDADCIISECLPKEVEGPMDTVISYILPEHTEETDIFGSAHATAIDLKLDMDDNESPAGVMDRSLLSTLMQTSLAAQTAPNLLDDY